MPSRPLSMLFLFALPATAFARAVAPPPPPPPPLPSLRIDDGVAEDRRLSVRCDERPTCTITLELDVVASGEGGATLRIEDAPNARVTLDPSFRDEAERDPNELHVPPGERAHVRIVAIRTLELHPRDGGGYILMADALFTRHMLLASWSPRMGGAQSLEGGGLSSVLFDPETVPSIRGPLVVSATLPARVTLSVDGNAVRGAASIEAGRAMELSLGAPPADDPILRNGGPFLAAGMQERGNGQEYFLLRAGYEIGIHDWVIAGASVETDFQTRFTSALLVEVATPPMMVLVLGLPSISAGIGATWDISERGHRAGVRLSAGAGLPVVSVRGTFDYYASDDEWVIGLVGQAGL